MKQKKVKDIKMSDANIEQSVEKFIKYQGDFLRNHCFLKVVNEQFIMYLDNDKDIELFNKLEKLDNCGLVTKYVANKFGCFSMGLIGQYLLWRGLLDVVGYEKTDIDPYAREAESPIYRVKSAAETRELPRKEVKFTTYKDKNQIIFYTPDTKTQKAKFEADYGNG